MTCPTATPARADREDALRAALTTQTVAAKAELREVVALFRERPDLEALPVVEADGRPIGAVLEREIRKLLLNPFGHALLQNHSLYRELTTVVSSVPTADIGAGMAHFFALISEGSGHDALIVTENGRFRGAISGRRLLRMAADREATIAAQREARLGRIGAATKAMRVEAAAMAEQISGASAKLQSAARGLTEQAGTAGAKGLSVLAAATQAADNVGEIAAQGHQLAADLGELGREVAEARASTARVGALIEDGGARARQLSEATDEIGQVVEAIDRIARRINLLALNATIEAAHAGEAGRGFAVVAAEVKVLAQQTRDAAGQISARIMGVRSGAGSVAAGHAGIEAAMVALEALSSTIDHTVMRNGAASQRISANVRDAAEANDHIRLEAAEISATASHAAADSQVMMGIARALGLGADRLQQRFNGFLEEIGRA